jgi:chromosome segregation ATPase
MSDEREDVPEAPRVPAEAATERGQGDPGKASEEAIAYEEVAEATSVNGTSNGAGETPENVIAGLAAAQRERATAAEQSQQAAKALEEDIKRLQTAYDEVQKAVEGYAQGRWNLEQQADERKRYFAKYGEVLKDGNRDVDRAWDELQADVRDLEAKKSDLSDQLVAAQAEQRAAERTRDSAQENLDAVKGRQARLSERVQKLGELESAIDSADPATADVELYVLLKEYAAELGRIGDGLKDVDAYRAEVQAAWRELEAAQRAVREAAAETTRSQALYDATTAELEQIRANRVEEIQKRVSGSAIYR